jgi:hypothetical protein
MSTTIRDVAKKAGVSLSTASLVLNDRPNDNPETNGAPDSDGVYANSMPPARH